MVGDQETLEAGHVVVLGVPGDEDGGGGDVADVKSGDGGERAELFILSCQQETTGQRFWLGALRTHLLNGKLSSVKYFSVFFSHFNNPPWPSFWWSRASGDSVGAKASGGKNGMSRPEGCLKVKGLMS